MKIGGILIVMCFLLQINYNKSVAQNINNDSISIRENNQIAKTTFTKSKNHSPKLATWLSVVVPGAGQVYNKKYWKVPIIYAAASGAIYGVWFNTKHYNEFRDAYIERLQTGQNHETYYARLQQETLVSARDYYRYYRDLSYIGLGAVYVLQIIDAAVDAHFFDFVIKDDLTVHITPMIVPQTASSFTSTQLLVSLKF